MPACTLFIREGAVVGAVAPARYSAASRAILPEGLSTPAGAAEVRA